jgi:hypothetical protein
LQPSSAPSEAAISSPSQYPSAPPKTLGSLGQSIKDAIAHVNEALNSAGIVLNADVMPYFNSKDFSVGVSVTMSATLSQTAADVIEVVSDYVAYSTNSSEDQSTSKMGLGNSSDTPVIDLSTLASNVALGAGMDVTFGIHFNLAKIQNGIFADYPFREALRKGISLYIETWGAFGEIIADPIELGVTLFGKDINIRDSHFATAADIRSRGKFVASIDDMISGGSAVDMSLLSPVLTVPLSTEFVFDIHATDDIIISPIMSVKSDNILDGDFAFDFDVDLGTFLNSNLMGENTLTSLLHNASAFLEEVAALKPELNASATPQAIEGFFTIVNELNDFGEELLRYIDIVHEGVFQGCSLS